jgi:hypothetical protein
MRPCGVWIGGWIGAIIIGTGSLAFAQPDATQPSPAALLPQPYSTSVLDIPTDLTAIDIPKLAVLPPEPPSVYAAPEPERVEDGVNNGGVNIDVDFRYLTDDVYRGISHDRAVYSAVPGQPVVGKLHAANYQVDATLSFNLGKLPHPFVGVFTDINDSDPVSRFQEIRPFFGLDYTLRPLSVSAGLNTYIYPEREKLSPSPNTSEVYVRMMLDDSYFFLTPKPILSPYVYGAYDYNRNQGWYLEAGLKHDFDFPDFGFTLSPYGDVAYISRFPQQFIVISPHSSGFQHYDIGLTGTFSLNHLFHVAPRYGQFAIEGYLTYTGKFSNPIVANTELWGGVGLKYRY